VDCKHNRDFAGIGFLPAKFSKVDTEARERQSAARAIIGMHHEPNSPDALLPRAKAENDGYTAFTDVRAHSNLAVNRALAFGANRMSHKGTAVITGADTTIGTAFAHRLAQRGYDLILIAANRPRLMILAASLTDSSGRSIEVLNADLAVPTEIARIEGVLSQDASITMLINHHSVTEEHETGAAIALGVTALMCFSDALVNGFVKRNTGIVINLVPVFEASSGSAIKSASSAFLLSLSDTLQQRFNNLSVRVQTVLYAGLQPIHFQSAVAIVDAALEDFDYGEAISLPTFAHRSACNAFAAARLELLGKVGGESGTVTPARLLH
jgi:short-subunit dehydrogenase